jgi:hypothetical protein
MTVHLKTGAAHAFEININCMENIMPIKMWRLTKLMGVTLIPQVIQILTEFK